MGSYPEGRTWAADIKNQSAEEKPEIKKGRNWRMEEKILLLTSLLIFLLLIRSRLVCVCVCHGQSRMKTYVCVYVM